MTPFLKNLSLKNLNDLSISERNIRLSYITNIMAMFLLYLPIRIIWMQEFLTNAQISVLTALIFISVFALELPTGAFADLVGKKKTVQIAYFVFALSMLAYVLAGNFWQFLIAVLLQGFSEALKSGARDALVYDSLVEDGREGEYKKVYSGLMSAVQLTMVVATFLGGFFGKIDLRLPFLLSGILLLLSTFLMSLMKEPVVDSDKFTFKNYLKQTRDGTRQIFKNKKIAKLSILYMLVGGIGWSFQRLLREMILIDVGYDGVGISIITSVVRLFNIFVFREIVKKMTNLKGAWDIVFLPVIMVLTYLLGFSIDKITAIPVVIGIMVVGTGRFWLLNPHLQAEISSKYRATAMSAANLLVSLILAANMLFMSGVIDRLGIPMLLIFYGFLSLLVVLPLALSVRKDFKS